MTTIHIPPAALEAGARAILHVIIYDIEPDVRANGLTDEEHALIARAAFEAMVTAWEGMHMEDESAPWVPRLILPLTQTQEASDDMA